MAGIAARNIQVSTRERRGDEESCGFDAIGNNAVPGAMKPFDSADANGGGARAFDVRAHFIEQISEVGNFWLARAICHYCLAICESRSHQEVFRARNGYFVEDD